MYEEFLKKVQLIAEHKYALNEDTLENYSKEIKLCHKQGFSPIRTVEVIAEYIFE